MLGHPVWSDAVRGTAVVGPIPGLDMGEDMTANLPEAKRSDVPELSGIVLVLTIIALLSVPTLLVLL